MAEGLAELSKRVDSTSTALFGTLERWKSGTFNTLPGDDGGYNSDSSDEDQEGRHMGNSLAGPTLTHGVRIQPIQKLVSGTFECRIKAANKLVPLIKK